MMTNSLKWYLIFGVSFFYLFSCNTSQIPNKMVSANAPVIIYKTKTDYMKNVPITLSEDKRRVVSFPGPGDLTYEGAPALPVKLRKGYLLDRRGINKNSVFTKYTYEEYSKFKTPPTEDEFLRNIIDEDPFLEIYDCRNNLNHAEDLAGELNGMIKNGFQECTRLK